MNYATIKPMDVANGPGIRVSLFVSGCEHYCENCFNAEAWAFDYGETYTTEIENQILEDLNSNYCKGLSLLGGEPFHPKNQADLLSLVRRTKEKYPNKTIWCYTGYVLEDILAGRVGNLDTATALLQHIDVLVDGKFVEALKNLSLRFRGSENQRLLDMPKTLSSGEIVLWDEASVT